MTGRLLGKSVLQGMAIFAASFGLYLYSPLSGVLKLAPLSVIQLTLALGIAAASVLWYELVKLAKKYARR